MIAVRGFGEMTGYTCNVCGKYHEGLPMSYGAAAPDYWYGLPEKERKRRAKLNPDLCVVDDTSFFIAGNIQIPVVDGDGPFSWTVWVSLSPESFNRVGELWYKQGRETEPPFFGWLSTRISIYPDTLNLKTMIQTMPVGIRPHIELEPTDHPLAVEQRRGITMARVQEIAELIEHAERL